MNRLDHTQPVEELPLAGVQFVADLSADLGQPIEVADGIWWIRLPLDSSIEHVNVYALRDGAGLTLVDSGVSTEASFAKLLLSLDSPQLKAFPLRRVIVTHFHPDHIGAAGRLAKLFAAQLWMSRTCWLSCKLLTQSSNATPCDSQVQFMRRAGLEGVQLEAFKRQDCNRYQRLVAPLCDSFTPLSDMQQVKIGNRTWQVAMGYGHAAEHVTLWTDGLAIVGDQILPGISVNLSVPFTEPDVDIVSEWLSSCRKLEQLASDEQLVLPGHQRPYRGCLSRLQQIHVSIETATQRLAKLMSMPQTAWDCMEQFYNRPLSLDERKQLLPEVIGYLNHLVLRGELNKRCNSQGAEVFSRSQLAGLKRLSAQAANPGVPMRPLAQLQHAPMQTTHQPTEDFIQLAPSALPPQPGDGSTDVRSTSSGSKRERRSRRARWLMGWVMLLALLAWIGSNRQKLPAIKLWATRQLESLLVFQPPNSPAIKLETAVLPVVVTKLKQLQATELPRRFTGILKARRASEVGFDRVGTIDKIAVDRGQRVVQGQVLASLNTAQLEASLKANQAQLEAAKARLDELIAGPRSQTVLAARNQVASAKAEFELAQASVNRTQRLVGVGAVSKQDVDESLAQLTGKRESLKSAEHQLDELLEGTRPEQIRAQQAVLKELEAAHEQIVVQLDESSIEAPFDAVVSERFLDPGAVCSPGLAVVRLVEARGPEAWIGLPPEYVEYLKPADSVQLTVGQRTVTGQFKSVLPELDNNTRTNTVVFEVQADAAAAWIGQAVDIELSRPIAESGFWVPMSAIIKGDQGLWGVLAVEPSSDAKTGRLVKRELEVIQVDSDRAYVRGTLQDGDQIVAFGLHRLTQGQVVRVTNEETPLNSRQTSPTTLR